MSVCQVGWCVALARTDGVLCAVHGDRGERFRTEQPETGDCTWCAGTGECSSCSGESLCTCRCGDEHDCHECNGDGECASCGGTGFKGMKGGKVASLDDEEKTYLEWAFSVFEPRIQCFTSPWDDA